MYNTVESSSAAPGNLPTQLTFRVQEDETKESGGEQDFLARPAPVSYEELFDKPISLHTAFIDINQPLDLQKWFPSRVRIFQAQLKVNGNFRILICQGASVLHEIIGTA